MPSPAAVLNILITANASQAQATLAKTQGQLQATQRTALGTGSAFDKAFGKAAATGTLIAFGAVITSSVKKATAFQDAMQRIHSTAGASQAEVQKMSKAVLDFAKSGSEAGPIELAKALYRVESAGYRGTKSINGMASALEVLKGAERLADVGGSDLESTTTALVGAMRSGVKGAGNVQKAIGTLNAIVGAGNMRMEDLVAAMGTGFLSNAKQMGISLKQAGAALAVLTVQGQPATQSATRLSMAFRMMMSPTDKAAAALKSIGLSAGQLGQMMQANKFPQAIALLSQRLNSLGDSPEALQKKATIIREVFGARSSAGINAILVGLDQYRRSLGQIAVDSSKFHEKEIADDRTLASQWDMLKSKVEAYQVQIGQFAEPYLRGALAQLNEALSGKGISGFFARIGADAVRSLFKQMLRLPSAGVSVIKTFSSMTQGGNLFHKALSGVNEISKRVIGIDFGAVPRTIKKTWSGLKDFMTHPFSSALSAITGFINKIIAVINTVLGPIGVHIGNIGGGGGGRRPAMTPGGQQARSKPARQRAHGGLAGIVPGSGIGDKVLMQAMVEPKEGVFIMNKNAMSALAAFNDKVPRFARGGLSSVTPGKRGAVTSNVGPNLAGAIGNFNLPGVGGLPQWIQPAGEFVLAKVGEYIKKKLASVVTGVGGDLLMRNHPGLQPGIAGIANTIMSRNKGLSVSSATRPGDSGSFHSLGRAIDLSGSPEAMYRAAGWISKHMTPLLTEGIHNPNLSVDTGRRVPPSFWGATTWAQHLSHIHLAKQRGGQIFGNRLSKDQLTTLAAYVGMSNPARMAAIAMAESGGNPRSTGGAGERGLWQILGSTAASFGLPWGKMYDPIKNARGAAKILKGQGLGAWTTYTSGAYKRFLGGQVKPGLLARLRGGAGATGTTAKVTKETTYGLLGTIDREALLESMQAAVEAENARRGTINELQAAQNLLALQRYQTGAAQNPLLGIPSPAMPALAQMLGMAPNAFLHAFPEPPVRSGKMRKGYGFGAGIVGQAQPPPVHVHIHAKKGAPDFTSWLDVQIEKKQKKAARLGRRRLPSAGAR